MSNTRTNQLRRRLLLAPLVGGLVAAVAAMPRPAQAQEKASVVAKSVGKVPERVDDEAWKAAEALTVPLAPQAIVKPRAYETGVAAISVRALYDAERLAFLLEWSDARSDPGITGARDFRDAAAIEFPVQPSNGIPYFAMGEPGKAVTIYQWKADWQFGRDRDVGERHAGMVADWYPFTGRAAGEVAQIADYGGETGDKVFHPSWWSGNALGNPELQARAPIEKLTAEGFGTLTSLGMEGQDAAGQGEWKDGAWRILIAIPRRQETFSFQSGMTVPFAFAVWDGAKEERGGEKAVSTWYFLSLEKPVGAALYWTPLVAAAGVAAAQLWGLRRLRRRAGSGNEQGPKAS